MRGSCKRMKITNSVILSGAKNLYNTIYYSTIRHLIGRYLFVEDLLMVSASTWCIGPGKLSETAFPISGKNLRKAASRRTRPFLCR